MRGVWVDGVNEGLSNTAEIDAVVAFAQQARLDTLVVTASGAGEAFANDLPLPRTTSERIDPPPFDPLAEVCDRAHAAGLAVHAAIAPLTVGTDEQPPERFAPFVTVRADGVRRDSQGLWHLDPALAETREHAAACAQALADRYPVDGIVLHRLRYPESPHWREDEWGYHRGALAQFRSDTGAEDEEPPEVRDPAWQAWRRDRVTGVLDAAVAAARSARAGILVSATGCCWGSLEGGWERSRPYLEIGQDWVGWIREERVDRVLAMNYRGDADDLDLVLEAPVGWDLRVPGAVSQCADPRMLTERYHAWNRLAVSVAGERAVVGVGLHLHPVDRGLSLIHHARSLTVEGRRPGGWYAYSYGIPSRDVWQGRLAAREGRDDLLTGLRETTKAARD